MSERVLVVIRHAKAESDAVRDFDRVLAARGHADARALGRWLGETGIVADAGLVSGAERTRETWDDVAMAAGWTCEPDFPEDLYMADEYDALELITRVDDAVGTLVVVGHNPTVHGLAVTVSDGTGDPDALAGLASRYPTSTVAVFDVPVPWASLGPDTARLRAVHVGRG